MDANTVVQLIGSLGFPIVAACYLAWADQHTMKEFSRTMAQNTAALQELSYLVKDLKEDREHDRERNI